MANAIAIISGDWHYHIWNQFNDNLERTIATENFIKKIFADADKNNIPILFTGDIFHTPKSIPNELFVRTMSLFSWLSRTYSTKVYGIPGNHDQPSMSIVGKAQPNYYMALCKAFPNTFIDISYTGKVLKEVGLTVCGVPYITHNAGFKEAVEEVGIWAKEAGIATNRILLIHSDIPGAIDDNGREIGESNLGRDLGKLFWRFDKVFSGHIHKYQPLWRDKVYMVGAPNQQRKSDMGGKFGYMILYDDMSTHFVNTKMPEFKTFNEGDFHEPTDDYWVMIPKAQSREDKPIVQAFKSKDRTTLAKKYMSSQKIKSKHKLSALINILNKIDD